MLGVVVLLVRAGARCAWSSFFKTYNQTSVRQRWGNFCVHHPDAGHRRCTPRRDFVAGRRWGAEPGDWARKAATTWGACLAAQHTHVWTLSVGPRQRVNLLDCATHICVLFHIFHTAFWLYGHIGEGVDAACACGSTAARTAFPLYTGLCCVLRAAAHSHAIASCSSVYQSVLQL